ncbi:MAG TPA: TlpA disulfide reductase family protein [Candidatus Limnocylindrales bacterium]|nr:TlpA disulfide reductase family protein [Candidatus Limnocylindrales bacterium]
MRQAPGQEPGHEPREEPEPGSGPRETRRGVIGPFTGRQLLTVLGVVVVAAIVLVLVTRPIAPAPGTGPATALPGATPFLVGEARVGLRPGDLAPELAWQAADGTAVELLDLDGNPVRLADLRGKRVWLNFWATWCPPCQAETPVLRELDERYRDQGLAIVAIAVQETTVDDVAAYAERYGLAYPIAFDASADVFDLYRVYALPTQVLIGPDGRITDVVNGPLTVESATKLLGLPPAESASPG